MKSSYLNYVKILKKIKLIPFKIPELYQVGSSESVDTLFGLLFPGA